MKPKNKQSTMIDRKYTIAFVLITSCFAAWGLANNMTDTLLAAFKRILSMNDFETSWIQIAFYGSYFCLALPAAFYIRKYSYKSGILLGLSLFIIGALGFYPASITMNYYHFLLALYILAAGLSILETSANPFVLTLGDSESAARRLNFAQSFNPIGSILGVLLSKLFILSNLNSADSSIRSQMSKFDLERIRLQELEAVMGPYVATASVLIMLWILIFFNKSIPNKKDNISNPQQNLKMVFKRLLNNKIYLSGLMAQFFYVGAQIGIWSFTIRYVMQELKVNEAEASTYYIYSLLLFAAFRFICTYLMKFVSPNKLLFYLSAIAAILTITVIFSNGYLGVYSLILISASMSLMFPTIFSISLNNLGEDSKFGGSGLIMMILGGAVLTAIQGQVSDIFGSIKISFLVPFVSFIVIILFSRYSINKQGI